MKFQNSISMELEAEIRDTNILANELHDECVRLDEKYKELTKKVNRHINIYLAEFILNTDSPERQKLLCNFESLQKSRAEVLASRNVKWEEYQEFVKKIGELNGQLIYEFIFCPDVSLPSVQILWKLENFRPRTQIWDKCWVDPLQLINSNIKSPQSYTGCVLYVKYLINDHQAAGISRVCKTLLIDKQIQYLQIIHYGNPDTLSFVDHAKSLMKADPDPNFVTKAKSISWIKKNRDEFHMRRMYFYSITLPDLMIVCDRDFCDIGDPRKGSREVNFLYVQRDNSKKINAGWKRGLHIEVPHSNTGCEMLRFLEIIFATEKDGWSRTSDRNLGDRIDMSFRHIQKDSQQRQLHTLVQFCHERGVKIVNIKTMLRSERSEEAKEMSPEEKKFSDDEEFDQHKNFAAAYDDMVIKFYTNTKRYGDHSNSIYCPKESLKLISDEGLQFFKEDDVEAHLQRPRAFSLFVLHGYKR